MCKDLTFIFQGPYYKKNTKKSIDTIRKNFPKSPIIFSTWESEEIDIDLNCLLLRCKDPGGKINSIWNTRDSTYRQIISTHCGLLRVRTKFACKIRSDTTLTNSKLEILINHLTKKNESNKLIFINYLSVNPKRYPLLYHFCDWIVAGKSNELLKMFTFSKNFPKLSYFKNHIDIYQFGWFCQYRSEQFLILNWIKNIKLNLNLPNYQTEINNNLIKQYEIFLKEKVIITPAEFIGVKNFKRPTDILINKKNGFFSSNYYALECRKAINIFGFSSIKIFFFFLFYSISNFVKLPLQSLKFLFHLLRYKYKLRLIFFKKKSKL